jgi:hypothetical protein
MKCYYILFLLTFILSSPCSSQNEPKDKLSQKEVFTQGFPKTLAFRNDRFGYEEGYKTWEKEYLKVNGVTKKYLTEEVDMDPVFANWANRFIKAHPEKLMLLHLNGEGINIKDKEVHEKYFPGHWVYEAGSFLTEDIDSLQTEFQLKSAETFSENAYPIHSRGKTLGKLPHIVLLVEIDENGKKIWETSEYATVEKVDYSANRISVKRGQYFSDPRYFKKNATYVAPIAGDHWGGNLMWYYNFSSSCPVDVNGNQSADVFLNEIREWFGKDGILKNLDGIGFDVNYFTVKHDSWDVNNDGISDKGIIDGKNVWREGDIEFLKKLRSSFGSDFIITADGWNDNMQRAVGILNGMETEGLARPNDGYRQISRTINQHTYWNIYNTTKYKFSYITSKLNFPADEEISSQLQRMGLGLASILGVAYTVKPSENFPEVYGGVLNKANWLGKPVGDMQFPAKKEADLLGGKGIAMESQLINQFNFENTEYREDDAVLYVKGTNEDRRNDLKLEGPELILPKGDLIVFFEAKDIDGFFDIKTHSRIPRKINLKINGRPVDVRQGETEQSIRFQNELAGFMGPSGFTPMSFYFRNVGNEDSPIKIIFEIEEQGEFAIKNLSAHNASSVIAREFENGIVLMNPSYEAYDFNLTKIFPKIGELSRIKVNPNNNNKSKEYNDGTQIKDVSRVNVPGLNALFLIKKD